MEGLFIRIVLGHFVADFLLQPKEMALKKSKKGLVGIAWCIAHCTIYVLCICGFAQNFSPLFAAMVFASHYPIDRWSLAAKWLKLIGGRDIKKEYLSSKPLREIHLNFSCIVYVVADNTIHIVLLWLIANIAI